MVDKPFHYLYNFTKQFRSLEHLYRWKCVLPARVKCVRLLVANQSDHYLKHLEAERFLLESIPQLKFANPSIRFCLHRTLQPLSQLTLFSTAKLNENQIRAESENSKELDELTELQLDISKLSVDQIKIRLEEFSNEKAEGEQLKLI